MYPPTSSSSSSSFSSSSSDPHHSRYYVYYAALDEIVNLTCSVDANPSKVSFYWTFNGSKNLSSSFASASSSSSSFRDENVMSNTKSGQRLSDDYNKMSRANKNVYTKNETNNINLGWKTLSSSNVHESSENIITIKPTSNDDFGLFACWAKNIAGLQTEPCLFALLPISK